MVRYYPQIKDSDFETNICNKKEFKKYIYKNNNNSTSNNSIYNLIKDQIFYNSLAPHQQFLVNYINPKTPYKGMLIYHETGTGKTCTAISIAENFKDELKKKYKKINVLCTKIVKEEFYRNMINIKNSSFKCTGNTYYDKNIDTNIQQKELYKRVDEFYQFYTYQQFGKDFFESISKLNKSNTKNISDETKLHIKKKYSHSFIILDEAHNLRRKFDTSDKSTEKIHHTCIDLISTYADNVKILFLTATPMFDTPIEIIWILNVLIRINNDNIPELKEEDIFTYSSSTGYSFTTKGKQKLIRAMKGKVSYLKSGNPKNFPIKIFEKNTNLKITNPTLDYEQKNLETNDEITKNLKLTFSKMSNYHYNIVNEAYKKKLDGENDNFHTLQQQLHNVAWYEPNKQKNTNVTNHWGNGGLKKYFTSNEGIYKIRDNTTNVLENLETFAPKIHNIVQQIIDMSSNGIAFIYSQFILAGIIPIILALEYNGFSKYTSNNSSFNHLRTKNNKIKRGKYIVITSNNILNADKKTIDIARSSKNSNGDIIRVIIVSKSGGEGLDLKYIRQVHILEPHFHFSDIEQAVGRAIRTNSHQELEPQKRNCTIYYHSTIYPDNINRETIDMHLYRLASKKRVAIHKVKDLIEQNSITCKFFKNINSIDWNSLIGSTIINCKGKSLIINKDNLHDSTNIIECNTCLTNNDTIDIDTIDNDTYDPQIHSKSHIYMAMKIICILFEHNNQFLLEDIQNYINQIDTEIDSETLYFALHIIINANTIIKNKFNIQGKIRKIDNYYKFVPNYSLYTNIYYDIPLQLSNSDIPMNSIPWLERPSLYNNNIIQRIQKEYTETINKIIFHVENDFWQKEEYSKYRNKLIANIIIDRLKPSEKFKLFYDQENLCTELKNAINRYKSDNNYFKNITSITKDNGYTIIDKNKLKIKTIRQKNNELSKRKLYAYYDFDTNQNGKLVIMDFRDPTKNPTGKTCKKQKIPVKNTINYLVKTHFMKYEKYIDTPDNIKPGQIPYANQKIKCEDLLFELNMIFRLLEILKNKDDNKWFYEYWESYQYKLKNMK